MFYFSYTNRLASKVVISLGLFFFVCTYPAKHDRHAGFVLITNLYNETNPARINEYITCLERNLSLSLIDTVHVIYDKAKDSSDKAQNKLLKYLKSKKVRMTYVHTRPTYAYCFHVANTLYSHRKVIFCNADIYFNQTLRRLVDYDLSNKFIALTRWNVWKDGSLKPYIWPDGTQAEYSQDTWIFQTPLKKFEDETIQIGVPHCDGKIAYQAHISDLKVFNPCLTIQSCHLHLSGIRNYGYVPFPGDGKIMKVPWVALGKDHRIYSSINKKSLLLFRTMKAIRNA